MQQTTPAVLPRLGLILALCGWLLFSLHDAAIKWLVADHSAWQVLFVRSAVILAICLAIGRRRLALPGGHVAGAPGSPCCVRWSLWRPGCAISRRRDT
jgi:hypothetical protein